MKFFFIGYGFIVMSILQGIRFSVVLRNQVIKIRRGQKKLSISWTDYLDLILIYFEARLLIAWNNNFRLRKTMQIPYHDDSQIIDFVFSTYYV